MPGRSHRISQRLLPTSRPVGISNPQLAIGNARSKDSTVRSKMSNSRRSN